MQAVAKTLIVLGIICVLAACLTFDFSYLSHLSDFQQSCAHLAIGGILMLLGAILQDAN